MTRFCDCKDVIVLAEGDGEFEAREIFCKEHGYQNNCGYNCHPAPEIFNTEHCIACGKRVYKDKNILYKCWACDHIRRTLTDDCDECIRLESVAMKGEAK